jgi:hypothetical protein
MEDEFPAGGVFTILQFFLYWLAGDLNLLEKYIDVIIT